ncbi:MAG TPA: outer membrane beta-barrel protein [Gemmatimonadaceae bacterium]
MKAPLFGLLALLIALPLSAQQVGFPPAGSPFRDLEYKQEITPYGGWANASTDAAQVLPQSAAIFGARYQLHLGGPVSFDGDFSRMSSTRNVVDPTQIAGKRIVGTTDAPVYGVNVGLALALTGRKSWHYLVPEVRGGAGVVTSNTKDDASGYSFGTPFAFTFGGGLKFVSTGRFQLRADVTERWYKQKYPDSFFVASSDNTSLLTTQARSFYPRQTLLTVGASLLFDR